MVGGGLPVAFRINQVAGHISHIASGLEKHTLYRRVCMCVCVCVCVCGGGGGHSDRWRLGTELEN